MKHVPLSPREFWPLYATEVEELCWHLLNNLCTDAQLDHAKYKGMTLREIAALIPRPKNTTWPTGTAEEVKHG